MSFFKKDVKIVSEDSSCDVDKPEKLKYVIREDGKGYWVRLNKPLSTDYDEDVYY